MNTSLLSNFNSQVFKKVFIIIVVTVFNEIFEFVCIKNIFCLTDIDSNNFMNKENINK